MESHTKTAILTTISLTCRERFGNTSQHMKITKLYPETYHIINVNELIPTKNIKDGGALLSYSTHKTFNITSAFC